MTRPSRRKIEREVEDLRDGVLIDSEFDHDLTTDEKEFLAETFDVDPDTETPHWRQERLDRLFAMSGVDA